MINENEQILKAKIYKKDSKILKKMEEFYEGFNALFYFLLKNPLNSLWWECISLTSQYSQMFVFMINDTVSINFSFINK